MSSSAIVFGVNTQQSSVLVDSYGALGNGTTDDSSAIQNAVNSSASVILFSSNKTYRINSPITIPSNKILDFQGAKILRGANIDNMFRNNSSGSVGGYTANENITLMNGRLDANGIPSSYSAGTYATQCSPIVFGHCTNVKCINMEIWSTKSWHSIEFNAVKYGDAIDCWFHDCDQSTVTCECIQPDYAGSSSQFPWFGPYDNTSCINITVNNCKFERVSTGVGSHSAFDGQYHRNIKIINSYFSNLTYEAIKCLNYYDVIVSENIIFNALILQNVDSGVINFATSSNTMVVERMVVSGNCIDTVGGGNPGGGNIGQGRAINCSGSALVVKQISIVNNVVKNCARHGITLDSVDNGVISGNSVTGCAGTGIWGYRVNRLAVTGNSSFGNATNVGRYDIALGGGAAPDRCTFVGNCMGTYGLLTASSTLTAANNQIG